VLAYLIRRLSYGVLVVFGVLLFLFFLFFTVTTPDDIARRSVGDKAMPAVIEQWKVNHGYHLPLWPGPGHYRENLLAEHMVKMLSFEFGKSDADGVPITQRISEGMGPSLLLALPLFAIELVVSLSIGLFVAFFRETYLDRLGVFLSVLSMSVSILLYIIFGQFLFGGVLRWFPMSGFDTSPTMAPRFLALPILVGVLASLGSSVRFYRTVFVEETHQDYVRTARAKGASDFRVMTRHVLPSAMIPVLTNVVMAIPFLFTGSLLLESGFGIPGLGSMTVEAINANDFATLRAMVFLGSLLFIVGQVMTDLSYALFDPRVSLE
jgi:peptide/nickel transport system permease protein